MLGRTLIIGGFALIAFGQSVEAVTPLLQCNQWFSGLSEDQRAKVSRPLSEISAWHFLPLNHARHPNRIEKGVYRGLGFQALSPEQISDLEKLLDDLFETSVSVQLRMIRQMDQILHDEDIPSKMNPEFVKENYGDRLYLVQILGEPGTQNEWGINVQGHHFSVTLKYRGNQRIGVGPVFFGAWPASRADQPQNLIPVLADAALVSIQNAAGIRLSDPDEKRPVRNKFEPGVDPLKTPVEGVDVSTLSPSAREAVAELANLYLNVLPARERDHYKSLVRSNLSTADKIYLKAYGETLRVKGPKSFQLRVLGNNPEGFVIDWVDADNDGVTSHDVDHIHSVWMPNKYIQVASNDSTVAWYQANAQKFMVDNDGTDHAAEYKLAFSHVQTSKPRVLDLGCAQGRDIDAFLKLGASSVIGIEPAQSLAEFAAARTGAQVINKKFEDVQVGEDLKPASFDLIWAMASLLHIPKSNQVEALKKIASLLASGGILFASYKVGSGDRVEARGEHDLLYFDIDEREFREMVSQVPELRIESLGIQEDYHRPGLKWLRAILRRV